MALNDLTFSIPRPIPWGLLVMSTVTAGFLAAAVATGEVGFAIFAILPGLIALALLACLPVAIDGSVVEEGIELIHPPMLIPFESIREIEAEFDPDEPPPDSFRIRVHHPWGVLTIPDAPDINSIGIYEALRSRFQISGSRAVNPILADHLGQNERIFGPERVWSFHAAPLRSSRTDRPRWGMAVGLAVLLTAIIWLVIAVLMPQQPANIWGAMAGQALFFGLITCAIAASRRGSSVRGIKNWQASSLVISPVGLAMVQGDIQGDLTWDQLRDVKFHPKGHFWTGHDTRFHGITLVVEGARIMIADIYDRPLGLIHDRIMRYWKPGHRDEPVDL